MGYYQLISRKLNCKNNFDSTGLLDFENQGGQPEKYRDKRGGTLCQVSGTLYSR